MTKIEAETQRALETLRDADTHRIHIAATGAGAGLQGLLWSMPGCSRLLTGASFPYAQSETDALLGHTPERYAASETAAGLAIAAYLKARRACGGKHEAVGVGITASVASLEEHRGDHRAHVAVLSKDRAVVTSVVLTKGRGFEARELDGRVVDMLGLIELLATVGSSEAGDATKSLLLSHITSMTRLMGTAADAALSSSLLANPLVLADGRRRPGTDLHAYLPGRLLLHAGTFNPPHAGHVEGARAAFDAFCACGVVKAGTRPRRLVHTITLDPPNKPCVRTTDALDRITALGAMGCDVLLSQGDPLFVDKAERMPGTAFVVGADTIMRMLDPLWGPSAQEVLGRLVRVGSTLYVVGRQVTNSQGSTQFVTVDHPWITNLVPSDMRFMLRSVPGRWDISSSELREAIQNNSAK